MIIDPETARLMRMGISSLANGVIGAGGILLADLTQHSGEITKGTWAIAAVTLIVLCCKDIQAYLSQPPIMPTQQP